MDSPRYFSEHAPLRRTKNRLPHWEQEGCSCFVTFRLADSLPQGRLREWEKEREAWMRHHPVPWTVEVEREYHARFSQRIEQWLDEGHGSCVLGEAGARAAVCKVLGKFEGERYEHHAWVVMPNHVHALFSPATGASLAKTMQGWKGVSSRAVQGEAGGGTLWQKDYFDTLIRDAEHFWRVARYIRRNPARLVAGRFTLFESDSVREELDREDAMKA